MFGWAEGRVPLGSVMHGGVLGVGEQLERCSAGCGCRAACIKQLLLGIVASLITYIIYQLFQMHKIFTDHVITDTMTKPFDKFAGDPKHPQHFAAIWQMRR